MATVPSPLFLLLLLPNPSQTGRVYSTSSHKSDYVIFDSDDSPSYKDLQWSTLWSPTLLTSLALFLWILLCLGHHRQSASPVLKHAQGTHGPTAHTCPGLLQVCFPSSHQKSTRIPLTSFLLLKCPLQASRRPPNKTATPFWFPVPLFTDFPL
jgi:hypothetical protein